MEDTIAAISTSTVSSGRNQRCKNQRGKCTVSGTTGIPLKKE